MLPLRFGVAAIVIAWAAIPVLLLCIVAVVSVAVVVVARASSPVRVVSEGCLSCIMLVVAVVCVLVRVDAVATLR
jgi:hypothetical protein